MTCIILIKNTNNNDLGSIVKKTSNFNDRIELYFEGMFVLRKMEKNVTN